MSAPAAISATFHDFRTVKGRKTCQFIFEVPVETANDALQALGGIPDAANPAWVAIARLTSESLPRNSEEGRQAEGEDTEGESFCGAQRASPAPKERKRWDELLLSQRAGIRCEEPEFWWFLAQHKFCTDQDIMPVNAEGCAEVVRQICRVKSRADLDTNETARILWHNLEDAYWIWCRDPRRSAA